MTIPKRETLPHCQLEELILAAFRRAEAEGRQDMAEHLLRALEALCPCSDAVPGGSAVAEAYRDLAREGPMIPADRDAGGASRRRFDRRRYH